MSLPETNTPPARRPFLRRGLVGAGLFAGGLFVGAAGLAVAHGDGGMGWHGGWHHHHGPRVAMMQHVVRNALDNVGATTAQEDKVHDVIAGAFTELSKDEDGEGRGAMRKQVLELMKAPTLDKAAFEALRAKKVAEMDAKSKVISNALFEAASQLSPEQRAKLAQNVEERMSHKGWGGWGHHHDHDGPDGKPGEHGPDGHGPDHDGPDHG